ncbi:hypothetical protein AB0O82_02515, partial [Kitasatospora sp. NPDC088264]
MTEAADGPAAAGTAIGSTPTGTGASTDASGAAPTTGLGDEVTGIEGVDGNVDVGVGDIAGRDGTEEATGAEAPAEGSTGTATLGLGPIGTEADADGLGTVGTVDTEAAGLGRTGTDAPELGTAEVDAAADTDGLGTVGTVDTEAAGLGRTGTDAPELGTAEVD